MSVAKFCSLVAGAKLNDADKKWFPRWMRSDACKLKISKGLLRVTVENVVDFSKSLRDSGAPAWERLQAVRAIEAHRHSVLRTKEPSLQKVRQTPSRIAAPGKGSFRRTAWRRILARGSFAGITYRCM